MVRLTESVRRKILEQNEGYSKRTYSEGRNSEEERIYTILGNELQIRSIGKTSWADSRYDKEWTASEEETHSFLYKYKTEMNLDGIE